jgi:superfamily I DNA/RNA helicase
VDVLADRPAGYRPDGAAGFRSYVPLPEILGEIAGVGPKSKSVLAQVAAMTERFGPELSILGDVPLDDLKPKAPSTVVEAIARLRRGDVRRDAGYDGVYGTIRLFDPDELASRGSGALFDLPRPDRAAGKRAAPARDRLPDAALAAGPSEPASGAPMPAPASPFDTDRQSVCEPGDADVAGLDADQRAVVTAERGPLLVVAGPGAGKTRVLVDMIAHRVSAGGVAPGRCLAVTFTRRAAGELRERLQSRLGGAAAEVTVATFHGLGLIIIRDQLGSDFAVTDDNLDELITVPVRLLTEDPALADAYRERWSDVFVDEYQDVDGQQYELLRCLTSQASPVTAIGDPDQAIYGFRGGDVGYFLRFRADYPLAREARLERSYRSAPTIVNAAMQLIRPGTLVPGRRLIPARTGIPDGPVVTRRCADEREEAEFVAAQVEKMLGGASFHALDTGAVDGRARAEHQLSFADFAVLARTSAQADPVIEALGRRGFPVQRRSHAKLAEMPGVPAIVSALSGRLMDDGGMSVAQRVRLAAEDALAGGGEVATAGLAEEALLSLASGCGDDLDRFLRELAMGAEVDTWDPRADRISMLTLHASKGLEFPVVFVVGCDDGLLPLRPWGGAEVDYSEERRLLFVGMTRATTRLVLTGAARRVIRGTLTECAPSPFLSSIDQALLDAPGEASRRKRRPPAQQLTLL